MIRTLLAAATAVALLGQDGFAALEVFNFSGPSSHNIGHSKTFTSTSGGASVTATAWRGTGNGDAPFTNLNSTFLSRYNNYGIGVEHAVDGNGNYDSTEPLTGSNNEAELLRLDFSSIGQDVSLSKVVFSWVRDQYDEFDVSVDGVDIDVRSSFSYTPFGAADEGSIRRIGTYLGSTLSYEVVFPDTLPAGKVFEFYTDDRYDQYKVKSVTVVTNDAVPEPTAFFVWSLLGLTAFRVYRPKIDRR